MMKYFEFSGKAQRSEYWGVLLLSALFSFVVSFVGGMFVGFGKAADIFGFIFVGNLIAISAIFVGTLASIATIARRCEDIGISKWWTISACIPYFSIIPLIVFGSVGSEKE